MGHSLGGVAAAGARDFLGADRIADCWGLLALLEQGSPGIAQGLGLDDDLVVQFKGLGHEGDGQLGDLAILHFDADDRRILIADHRAGQHIGSDWDFEKLKPPLDIAGYANLSAF